MRDSIWDSVGFTHHGIQRDSVGFSGIHRDSRLRDSLEPPLWGFLNPAPIPAAPVGVAGLERKALDV